MKPLIKITKSLKFDLWDLMKQVDPDYNFTLRDVLNACMRSKIPIEQLQEMLQCRYIEDYWKEMKSRKFKDDKDRDLEYLELAWTGDIHEFDGRIDCGSSWDFYGVGKEGCIPEDLLKWSTKKEIAQMKKDGYRQSYAIEFSPMYTLANYPIKICKELRVEDWRDYKKKIKKKEDLWKTIDIQPSITLMELLYWIFWELSFCGSPEQRDGKLEDIGNTVEELKKAEEEGRLEEVTVPWEEVKEKLENKVKKLKKKSKKGKKNGMRRV
jgi:hypothetical protein